MHILCNKRDYWHALCTVCVCVSTIIDNNILESMYEHFFYQYWKKIEHLPSQT